MAEAECTETYDSFGFELLNLFLYLVPGQFVEHLVDLFHEPVFLSDCTSRRAWRVFESEVCWRLQWLLWFRVSVAMQYGVVGI